MASRKFRHHYLVMRHGESTTNVNHVMITDPKIDGPQYGLTDLGKKQCEASGAVMRAYIQKSGYSLDDIFIHYSDFERTKQSALIVFNCVFGENAKDSKYARLHFKPSKALRARNYGDLNGLSGTKMMQKFVEISNMDKINPNHATYNVESFNDSMNRIKQFVIHMEEEAIKNNEKKKLIIIVSHAMSSQTLQSWFQINDTIPVPMENGEFRDLSALIKTRAKL